MKTYVIVIFLLLLDLPCVFAEEPASKPNEIVINMKYHGGGVGEVEAISDTEPLLPDDDSFGINKKNEFCFYKKVKNLYSDVRQCPIFFDHNIYFVYEKEKVTAVYYDLNQDGNIDPKDKLTKIEGIGDRGECYIAGDFDLQISSEKRRPFKFMVKVEFDKHEQKTKLIYYSCGYYTGKINANGKNYTLFLLPEGLSYLYTKFGESEYVLASDGENIRWKNPSTLTSRIKIGSQIHDLKSVEYSNDGRELKIVLVESVKPLADFDIKLLGLSQMKYEYSELHLLSEDGYTIKIDWADSQKQIPEGRYKIVETIIFCGKESTDDFIFYLGGSDFFDVKHGQENVVNLGLPHFKMHCYSAEDEQEGINAIPTKEMDITQTLNISIFLTGIANEGYCGFMKKYKEGGFSSHYPTICILNGSGKVIQKSTLFQRLRFDIDSKKTYDCFSWRPEKPGKYTVVVSMDTGPLGGVLEDKWEITVIDKKQRMIIMCASGGILAVILVILTFTWKKGFKKRSAAAGVVH